MLSQRNGISPAQAHSCCCLFDGRVSAPSPGLFEPAAAPPNASRTDTSLVIRSREVKIAVASIPEATTLILPTLKRKR